MRKILVLIALSILSASCSPIPASAPELTYTQTQVLAVTTPNPSLTPLSPTDTPIPTEVPQKVRESAMETYRLMVLTQMGIQLLSQTAERIYIGESTGFEGFAEQLFSGSFLMAAHEEAPIHEPDPLLAIHWAKAYDALGHAGNLYVQWVGDEIDTVDVMDGTKGLLDEIDAALQGAERSMQISFGIRASEFSALRKELKRSVENIYATDTPTP